MERVLSNDDVQRMLRTDAPTVRKAVLVVAGERMYRHEEDGWYPLDDKPHSTLQEFVDATG